MKLYELSAEVRDIGAMLDAEDVDRDSFLAALDAVTIERDAKIANLGLLIKEIRADQDARKQAIKQLQDRNKAADNRIEWLRGYIAQHIDNPVKTALVSVNKQKGRLSLVVSDEAQLPDRFYCRELNKTELKSAVTSGEEYYGVSMERGPEIVVIR